MNELIEFQSAQIKALQAENEKLRKSVAEANEILTSILNEIEVNETEIIEP